MAGGQGCIIQNDTEIDRFQILLKLFLKMEGMLMLQKNSKKLSNFSPAYKSQAGQIEFSIFAWGMYVKIRFGIYRDESDSLNGRLLFSDNFGNTFLELFYDENGMISASKDTNANQVKYSMLNIDEFVAGIPPIVFYAMINSMCIQSWDVQVE